MDAIDSRVVESIALRRCNAFISKALADSQASRDLSIVCIQHLDNTLEYIRHNSVLDQSIKQSFKQHQEKLRKMMNSNINASSTSMDDSNDPYVDRPVGHNEMSSTAQDDRNPSVLRAQKSSIHKPRKENSDVHDAAQVEINSGMKMQRLMRDQKVVICYGPCHCLL